MPETTPTVLIVGDDSETVEKHAGWLSETCSVRTANDGPDAIERVDSAVDVVVLDRTLPTIDGDEVLGLLRQRDVNCQVVMLIDNEPSIDTLKLDVNEYISRPVSRDELRETVSGVEQRQAIEQAVDSYLSLLPEKQAFEDSYSGDELADTEQYKAIKTELVKRRRQVDTLLRSLDPSSSQGSGESVSDTDNERRDEEKEGSSEWTEISSPPRYRVRTKEFYALWLFAALTYGVGDVLSTIATVISTPGVSEANPAVKTVLENFGLPGFLLLKILVFLVLLSISVQGARSNDQFSYYWPPVLSTLLGVALTVWNVWLSISPIGL